MASAKAKRPCMMATETMAANTAGGVGMCERVGARAFQDQATSQDSGRCFRQSRPLSTTASMVSEKAYSETSAS
eukprot:15481928-Alexandrium_andersonii.AAC.1